MCVIVLLYILCILTHTLSVYIDTYIIRNARIPLSYIVDDALTNVREINTEKKKDTYNLAV